MNDDRRHSARINLHANGMGTSQTAIPPREPARLYLVTPPIGDAGAIADGLADALNAADIAAVLVRLSAGDEHTQIERVKALRILIQSNGAALLLDGRPDLVVPTEADGAHFVGTAAFQASAAALKPKFITGCGGLVTRHDAMEAAESGADYVMFGEPDSDGRKPAFDAILDRVAWWSEIFQVPCVAYADNLDEAEALAQAGADFVAIGESVWCGGRDAVAAAARRLSIAEPVQ
ncbi:MAG: thiamine phosphate synthase [Rhizomicrobium sp.]